MPELPELEVVRDVLQRRVVGRTIADARLIPPGGPIVARDLANVGFEGGISGATITGIRRRGKFLVFSLQTESGPLFLAINPKLTGRLQLAAHFLARIPPSRGLTHGWARFEAKGAPMWPPEPGSPAP